MKHRLLWLAILVEQSLALYTMLHRSPHVIMFHHISHDVFAACLFPFSLNLACECQVAWRILPIDVIITFVGILSKLDLHWIRSELLQFLKHLLFIQAVIVDWNWCWRRILNLSVFLFFNRWIEASPLLLKQHCKLRIANRPTVRWVKITEQGLDVVKTKFYPHVLHSLGEFVKWNTLSVVHIKEAKAALQIQETLTYFSRHNIEQHSYVLLLRSQKQLLSSIFSHQAFAPLVFCAFGIWRHNVCDLVTIIFVAEIAYFHRVKIKQIDKLFQKLDSNDKLHPWSIRVPVIANNVVLLIIANLN